MLPVARRTPVDPGWLRKIYEQHYQYFARNTPAQLAGLRLEIGSGDGFLKDVVPEVVTSEIWAADNAQLQCSALTLPIKDNSVACLYLLDVLHHLKTPADFFREADRVLVPGGRILMIEPANTIFGRFIFQRFHHETFAPDALDWDLPSGDVREVANGALPWILLHRDRAQFSQQFPRLAVKLLRPHMPVSYLLSGGLSQPQLLPTGWFTGVRWLEDRLPQGVLNHCGMFYQISLEKVSNTEMQT